jgi:hypothetical protein
MGVLTVSTTKGKTLRSLIEAAKTPGGITSNGDGTYSPGGGDGPRDNLYGDIVLGDSISTNAGYASWFEFLCILSNGRLQWSRNAAIGGNTTQQMIDRFAADVAAYTPARVHLMCGTNDWPTVTTPAQADAQMVLFDSLVAKIYAIGATQIVYAMPPKMSYLPHIARGNAAYSRYCALRGIQFIDFWGRQIDPATGTWAAGVSDDGTHPLSFVHVQLGKDALERIILPSEMIKLPTCIGDGLTDDPLCQSAASATYGASAASASSSNVAGSYPVIGNWRRLTISGATGAVQLDLSPIANASTLMLSGDKILVTMRLRVSGMTPQNTARWQIRFGTGAAQQYPGVSGVQGGVDFDGIFSCVYTMSQNGNNYQTKPQLWADSADANAMSGVIEVAQIGVWNLSRIGGMNP